MRTWSRFVALHVLGCVSHNVGVAHLILSSVIVQNLSAVPRRAWKKPELVIKYQKANGTHKKPNAALIKTKLATMRTCIH